MSEKSDELPEVFSIFEQKLAHVLSFTVVPLKSKDMKNALAEILTYFSGIVERASKAESRIAKLEKQLYEEKLLSNQLYLLLVDDPKTKKNADKHIEALEREFGRSMRDEL